MKKTCIKCRAFSNNKCSLNFKIEKIYIDRIGSPVIGAIPLEKCPKPLTIKDYIFYKTN
jgi:hypothetical protein